ncbi:MAG TPA: F0F1 ATP synthase subunit delta [Dermatophilaceae bacterium]|jgi:F-type H+-transporting ATPase subunit delta
MQGSSRAAFVVARDAFATALGSGADLSALAEDLFGATAALDSSASLRRALVDPSRDATAKRGLVEGLFGPKVTPAAADLLKTLVSQRWADDRDLGDATESLAVEAVVASAEAGGRLDALEDDLFRFERVVAADSGLRDALSAHGGDENAKSALVVALLEGKSDPEAIRLARQAATAPRGRRFNRVLESYLAIAAIRREQLTATVTAAVPLTGVQRQRLAGVLARIYDRAVQISVVLDPAVVGGIRVQVGDEVVDGTILRRLEEAERALLM